MWLWDKNDLIECFGNLQGDGYIRFEGGLKIYFSLVISEHSFIKCIYFD